jgi:UDP-N-acetylmuramyl-tripeptide synthetase
VTILKSLNQSFTSITSDSRKVQKGSLFLAYPGKHSDGRNYIAQAVQGGAEAVVWEQNDFTWNFNMQVNNLPVKNLKQQVGNIAAEFYLHPSRKLTMIGVTGTNGKTSVSQWIAQCLTFVGKKTAVLGTIGNGFLGTQTESANTTPDAILLQEMLAEYVNQHADVVAMEVSSHGLDQGRVNGVEFDIAVLTNLSRDHLDYHETMEAYAIAKRKLLTWEGLDSVIVNVDDAFGKTLVDSLKAQTTHCITYGFGAADLHASNLKLHDTGLSMQVTTPQGSALMNAPVLGRFNAYNVLAVLATLLAFKVSFNEALVAIKQIKPVQGRMQQFGGVNQPLVVVDYAHTPDALEKVLSTLREQTKKKLICVFGCGGDRDVGKRPLMGAVVDSLADLVIVTSDNPRSEDPDRIIKAILVGMKNTTIVESDRAQAIRKAVQTAGKGDVVLIAGKGHEEYQEIAGVKHFFSDAAHVKSALETFV